MSESKINYKNSLKCVTNVSLSSWFRLQFWDEEHRIQHMLPLALSKQSIPGGSNAHISRANVSPYRKTHCIRFWAEKFHPFIREKWRTLAIIWCIGRALVLQVKGNSNWCHSPQAFIFFNLVSISLNCSLRPNY